MEGIKLVRHASRRIHSVPLPPVSKIRRESQGDLGGQPTPGTFCELSGNYCGITVGDLNKSPHPSYPPPPFFLLWDIKGASWPAWEQRSYSRNLLTATLSPAFTALECLPEGNSTCSLRCHQGWSSTLAPSGEGRASNSSFKIEIAFTHYSVACQAQEALSPLHFKHFAV